MNMKMKVFHFLWIIFGLAHTLNAQSGTVASGGDINTSSGTIAFSVGQIAYAPIVGESGDINPGLQQPFQFGLVSTNDIRWGYALKLFPNPASQLMFLQLSSDAENLREHDFTAMVYDAAGHFLFSQKVVDVVTTFAISALPEAQYFIQILKDNTPVQSISFNKTN